MIVQTTLDGIVTNAARWSDDLIGVAGVQDGREVALWVAGPTTAPRLVDEHDQPLRPDVVAEASEVAASVPTRKGPCVDGWWLDHAVRHWWSVPLPASAAGQSEVAFRLVINGEVLAGRARRPPSDARRPAGRRASGQSRALGPRAAS